jgi:hypothetical protein
MPAAMDPHLSSAPPLSVKLLRLGIEHQIELAEEAGLAETALALRQALETLGGPLPSAARRSRPS